jgi:hypothetical protein
VTVFRDTQETFSAKPSPDLQKQVLAAVAAIA